MMSTLPLDSLPEHFRSLPDPRLRRARRHELVDILVIGVCTLLCGGESFNDMEDFGHAKDDWLRTFLDLPNGIPTHDTFNRVFAALDPGAFLDCFLAWTRTFRERVDQEIVAMDGKALRRARDGGSIPYIVSAWSTTNGLVLGQLKVPDKTNEITAIPSLIRALNLHGCTVTIDAMGCQKRIAGEVVAAGADYVFSLKGNQETVHQEMRDFLEGQLLADATKLASCQQVEKDHGRLETRKVWLSDQLDWFEDLAKWEGLRTVGMVESTRETKQGTTTERRFFLSSLPLDVERFARAVRGHWEVENQLHWVLDVQMNEDQSRARTGYAAENLATLRRLALNLLKQEQTKKRGIKGKQKNAGWDHRYLLKLLRL